MSVTDTLRDALFTDLQAGTYTLAPRSIERAPRKLEDVRKPSIMAWLNKQ